MIQDISMDSHSQGTDSTKEVSLKLSTPLSSWSKCSSNVSDSSSHTNLSRYASSTITPTEVKPTSQEVYSIANSIITLSSHEDELDNQWNDQDILAETLKKFQADTTKCNTPLSPNPEGYQNDSAFVPDKYGAITSNWNEMKTMNSNLKTSEITRF